MPANPKTALDRAHEAIDDLCGRIDESARLDHRKRGCCACKEAHAALEEAVADARSEEDAHL